MGSNRISAECFPVFLGAPEYRHTALDERADCCRFDARQLRESRTTGSSPQIFSPSNALETGTQAGSHPFGKWFAVYQGWGARFFKGLRDISPLRNCPLVHSWDILKPLTTAFDSTIALVPRCRKTAPGKAWRNPKWTTSGPCLAELFVNPLINNEFTRIST